MCGCTACGSLAKSPANSVRTAAGCHVLRARGRAPSAEEHRLGGMRRPSRNDIRLAASRFSAAWELETRERGEAQTFWTEFLALFGVERRRANAAFERHARRKSTGGVGFIDLLWPGMLLAEQK